jgi:hypothetical protein
MSVVLEQLFLTGYLPAKPVEPSFSESRILMVPAILKKPLKAS